MAKSIKSDFSDGANTFERKAYDTIETAEAVAKNTIDELENRAKDRVQLVSSAMRAVTGATDKMKQWVHQAEDASLAQKEELENRIRSRPFTSSAIAFGIGLLAGKLLISGKKDRR